MKYAILASGSKGNATLIQIGNLKFVIDVGISFSALKRHLHRFGLDTDDIDYYLLTHEHSDHTKGIKKVDPLKLIVPVGLTGYSNTLEASTTYQFEDVEVFTIPLSHDSAVGFGYLFTYKDQKLAYFTDSGYFANDYIPLLSNCNYYIFESNHDEKMLLSSSRPYFVKKRILSEVGHLSNTQSAHALSKMIGVNTQEVVLAHLSEQANCESVALETHYEIYKAAGIDTDRIRLVCAKQDEIVIGGLNIDEC